MRQRERVRRRLDPKHISTSYVERQNWTVRTNMRRDTRLSNGFSRKVENHAAAVALKYFAYNFINIHRTLRVTPAMAAKVTARLFDVSDIVALLEASESKKAAKGVIMSANMKCPKCKTVTKGELAGKVGFSGPGGGPLPALPTPALERYHLECKQCGHVWYPDTSEVNSK